MTGCNMGRIKFMTGKLSVLEELEMYKAMNAGPVHVYAPSLRKGPTMAYRTLMDWDEGQNWVILKRDGVEVAKMTLDEWMELHAVRYAAEELMQQAGHSLPPADRADTAE